MKWNYIMSKVWFIAGSGIGVAKAALRAGESVVATGRNLDKVQSALHHVRATLFIVACGTMALALTGLVQMAYSGDAVGWRHDGKGEFKALNAPTRWSLEAGLAWRIQLPATSISSPVVTGERAFVMAEPNRLLCVRLSDGKVLWDRTHEYEDVFRPTQVKEIKQRHAESQEVRQEIAELEKQLKSAQDAKNSNSVLSLQNRIRTLQLRDEELTAIPPPQTDASTGNTASTPVCDHENVYAVLGNGIVSSHRLDGQQNWIEFIDKPMARHSASPLIVGNLLIVHFQQLIGLDRRSGDIVWKADTPPRNGTPVMVTLGQQAVIVTPAGAIVRGEDGKVLAKGLFDLAYCSPIAHENVVYAAERGRLLAIKVSPGDKNTIRTDVLWQTRGAQEDRLASPVIHGGLLFSATGTGILDVVEIKTGKILKRKRMELGQGRVDASLSLANHRLYIQSTNGTTVVLEPTPDCPEVARNKAEGSSSSPFFVDERILFRTPTHLICIAGKHEHAGLDPR
jgi:outer membrane protein assembly factor BamB